MNTTELKTFRVEFIGRKLGAIGITYPISVLREARNADDCYSEFIVWVYSQYEHISQVKVTPVTE